MIHSIFSNSPPPLLLAIGNDGRQDDGLGWAFGQAMEASEIFRGDIVYRYQLQVEDALLIADQPTVVFVDACREELPAGFDLTPLHPAADFGVTTHQLSPATVLSLAKQLYNAHPQAYLLKIMGVEWGLKRGLSERGRQCLNQALVFSSSKAYTLSR
jgi:hydrogenase maturation protease